MADSKFSYVRALVQDGSLTNLATASPWTVTHPGGIGLTLTTASRIIAESGPIGRAATLCAEAVVSLDTAFAGSTVLSAGLASIAMNSDGQLGCMLDGIQVDVLNIPLASQRVLCAIEYGVDGANENYFFRATGETSGGTVSTTAVASALTYPGNATSKTVVGGLLGDTVQASPAQGTVNVSTTRPGVASTAVPHIVAIEPAINLLDGRTAPSTGGAVTVTAERGSSSVTYTIPNTAGMSINSLGAALAAGIASQIGGTTSTSGGKTYITTATNEDNQNWFIWFDALGLSYPAEPPVWGPSNAGGAVFQERITQSGVYGAPGGSVTQRNVISLTLPAANADVNLSVSLQPTLNATANMGVVAAGLDSLVAQIAAVGFTASWQQIGAGQYIINTERLTPGAFALTANLTVSAGSVSNPVTTLHAMRVTTAARYTAVGGVPDEFPTLPWPTTSIPGGGGGGTSAYAVWDSAWSAPHTTITNSGRTSSIATYVDGSERTTVGKTTGTWYFEVDLSDQGGSGGHNGIAGVIDASFQQSEYMSGPNTSIGWLAANGSIYEGNSPTGSLSCTTPIIVGVEFNAGTRQVRFHTNNGVSAQYTLPGTGAIYGALSSSSGTDIAIGTINAGQAAFTYGLPVGAQALGGTGWGTLPADVIFAVNAETNGNDVAQFGLSATASGTATIQASGSRTGDGYLRNTDSAQGADACFGYTPSAGFKSAWGAAQSMTLEFDIRYDAGGYLGGQILGIGSGYSSLSDNGPSGIAITGSPFAVAAGSATLTPGTWHHIAFVADYNAGDRLIRTYRDGVQQDTPQSVGSFWFNDYPNPTTIGLLQLYAGFIGNGALKGGMDNIVLTTRAKYSANFTPGVSFPEIVGYTPPPSNVDVTAAGYHDIDDITGSGTFNTQLTAPEAYFFSSATLDDSVSTGDAYTVDGNSINFTGPRTLANTTCTGTFVYGTPQNFDSDVTLDDNTAVSTFYADTPKEWTGESTLDNVTSFGLMMFLAPAMFSGESVADEVTASGSFSMIDPVVWRVNATVPAATLAARINQFFVNATVPPAELVASISAYEGFRLDATVPSATVSAWTGISLNAEVPRVTLSASATVPNTLRLDSQLPRVVSQANLLTGRSLAVNATLPAATLSAWTGLQLAASVPIASSAGNVVVGGAFSVSPGLVPMATLAAGASSMNVLRLNGAVPAASRAGWVAVNRNVPSARMLGSITPVVAVTRVAYSFTLSNSAMTRYPAYPFIQVFRMGNAYYGVAEDGLYELGGITDNGVSIPWSWETCMADFGQAEKKTVVSAYLGGYVPQNMTYTIKAGDVPTGTNAHTTTATAVLRNHRQKFGIGRKSRFFAFGLSATQGRVAIESIEFEMATMSRRV